MALKSPVQDTYLRYKTGSKAFVQWLASAARATGAVEYLFNISTKVTAKVEHKHIQIPLSAYAKLAEAVLFSPTIEVPSSMFTVLRDAIHQRKECAAYYRRKSAKGKNVECPSDARHAYCISVLESTLAILSQNENKDTRDQAGSHTTKVAGLKNCFTSLELENTTENAADEGLNVVPGVVLVDDTYTPEPTEEDAEFAFFCLLKDATDIRFFVRRTWRQNKAGRLTLETAAVTMNTSIQVIEQLNKAFLGAFPKFPEFEHHSKILKFIWNKRWRDDIVKEPNGGQEWEMAYNDGVQQLDYASFSCDQVAYLVDQLLLFPLGSNFFDDGLPRLDGFGVPLAGHEVTFWKTLIQLAIVSQPGLSGVPQDTVLKAMNGVLTRRKCPTWAVFAFQCVRDIQLEFASSNSNHKMELREATDPALLALLGYASYTAHKGIGKWHDANLSEILNFNNRTTISICGNVVEDAIVRLGLTDQGRFFGEQFLLDKHPMMRGLIGQNTLVTAQIWATVMAASHGVITAVSHLYNAAQATGLLPAAIHWEDLDYYISELSEDMVFKSPRPLHDSEFNTCFKRACNYRIFGSSGSERLTRKVVKEAERHLARGKDLHLRFFSSYTYVSTNIKAGKVKFSDAHYNPELLLRKMLAKESKRANLTPLQALTDFREVLERDQSPLRFNILGLWLRCYKLLLAICDDLMRNSPRDYPADQYKHGSGGIMAVSSLLSERAGFVPVEKPQFPNAVKTMLKIIESEGCKELKLVEDQVKSKAMKEKDEAVEKEPSFENPPEDAVDFGDRIKYFLKAEKGQGYRFVLLRNGKYEQAFTDGYYMVPKLGARKPTP
jgi:hypothetical protein